MSDGPFIRVPLPEGVEYQRIATVGEESSHDELWVTEEEAARILAESLDEAADSFITGKGLCFMGSVTEDES